MPPDPISRDLRNAFWGSIGAYHDWCQGQPEPGVSLDQKQVSISWVCDLSRDPMPDDLWRLLEAKARGSAELIEDRSFGSAARWLARLIREKRESFDRPRPGE